jgi:hypothetical protein
LKILQDRGASLLEPTVEALAALDALASILGDAKSGDLANEATPLGSSAVLAWLKTLRNDLALEPIRELVDSLFGAQGAVVNSEEQDLVALLSHEHVITVELAAQILGQPQDRVLTLARKSPSHCLVLEGPPAVLLDVSGVAAQGEAAE